ncbi:MAG: hypothetical protein BWY95_02439 [Bacteroidetes bacterium ADurb.BinA104]|nr:MAG: hypothetical protein BWY95_02439 [Bacteroidetes bacterium ADurb.BinA104]
MAEQRLLTILGITKLLIIPIKHGGNIFVKNMQIQHNIMVLVDISNINPLEQTTLV